MPAEDDVDTCLVQELLPARPRALRLLKVPVVGVVPRHVEHDDDPRGNRSIHLFQILLEPPGQRRIRSGRTRRDPFDGA